MASDSAEMPTKNSEDGEIIHFSELETILTTVANNPEKIGSRTCMRSGALKSVDKEFAHMKFRCGIIMTPSDRLFIFLVRHALGEGLDDTPFSADFPEALNNLNTFVALPWEFNAIQDAMFFLVTLKHMELLGTYHIRTSSGLGIKLEGFDTVESCVKFNIHHARSNLKKVTPAQLQTNDPEVFYVDMTNSDWIQRIRQIGICILLGLRTVSRATGRDTV